jgi:hypothetical protein
MSETTLVNVLVLEERRVDWGLEFCVTLAYGCFVVVFVIVGLSLYLK